MKARNVKSPDCSVLDSRVDTGHLGVSTWEPDEWCLLSAPIPAPWPRETLPPCPVQPAPPQKRTLSRTALNYSVLIPRRFASKSAFTHFLCVRGFPYDVGLTPWNLGGLLREHGRPAARQLTARSCFRWIWNFQINDCVYRVAFSVFQGSLLRCQRLALFSFIIVQIEK